jgi:chemotaxis protein histidine kinase CheA
VLDDPEIIKDFCDESDALFEELTDALECLEDNPKDTSKLEKFGQVIDRIMGAAKSIEAHDIATFCELGKVIGYKSSQVQDSVIVNVVVAILFDAVDILTKMVYGLRTGDKSALKDLNMEAFGTRLKWLSEKFKHIERASVAFTAEQKKEKEKKETQLNQSSIDDLMAALGL